MLASTSAMGMATASSFSSSSLRTTVLLLVLGALLTLISSALAMDYIEDVSVADKHRQWMAEHGRVYKDAEEHQRRFEIFRDNFFKMENFNSNGTNTYTVGLNEFSDMTHDEFVATHKCTQLPPRPDLSQLPEGAVLADETYLENLSAIPDFVDWRLQGAVNPAMQQGLCSACWAFAATGAAEGIIKINYGPLYQLSAQQLVDCDKASDGCDGGFPAMAIRYMATNGITTEAMYPYTGVGGTCRNAQPIVKIKSFGYVQENKENVLKAVVARSPVAVGVDGLNWPFQNYKSGIFRGPCTADINHAVLIVGYGTQNGEDYWIVRNSYGSTWGQNGFGYMLRNTQDPRGLCGIATAASYAVL